MRCSGCGAGPQRAQQVRRHQLAGGQRLQGGRGGGALQRGRRRQASIVCSELPGAFQGTLQAFGMPVPLALMDKAVCPLRSQASRLQRLQGHDT